MTKCLVCGTRDAPAKPWCSSMCRLLLREEGRARFPRLPDRAMWPKVIAWARDRRTAGPQGAITERVSARLNAIPTTGDRPSHSGKPSTQGFGSVEAP